jgi:arylsulfatase A-like enzyme
MRGVATAAGLVLLLWLAACGGRGAPDSPGRIILLSMDTVRLDAVGAPPSEDLPHLRRIAAEGATFANFYAASTYTIPSHMSIFTGLDPESHGVEDEFTVLAEGIAPLAERLRMAGYRTQAFHEGGYVDALYGFQRGFARYEENPRVSVVQEHLERVLKWMRENAGHRYFLFLHTYAAHNPYGGYEAYRAEHPERGLPSPDEARRLGNALREQRAADPHASPPWLHDLTLYNQLCDRRHERLAAAPPLLSPDFRDAPHFEQDIAAIRRNYARRIELVDAALGRIRELLERDGLWDDTLLVVTSDHGEAFFEHGLSWHGYVPFDEVLRVPLVVSYPRLLRGVGPFLLEDLAWHPDLYPTILALAGLAAEPRRGARDLGPLLRGSGGSPGKRAIFPVVMEVPFKSMRPPRRAVIHDGLKFVEGSPHFGLAGDLLFDLRADPDERHNLVASRNADAERLRALLESHRRDLERHGAGRREQPSVPSGAHRERLRELGYVE